MHATARDERRRDILKAASRLLARYGFDKMTMRDVGEEVGLNKASLYYYFPGKEALVAAVIGAEITEFITGLQRKIGAEKDCRGRITHYLVERFRNMQRVMNLHNLTLQDLRKVSPVLRALYRDFKHMEASFLQSILDGCVRDGEMTPCDTYKVAATIVTVAEGYKLELLNDYSSPPEAAIDYSVFEDDLIYTVNLILDGLRST